MPFVEVFKAIFLLKYCNYANITISNTRTDQQTFTEQPFAYRLKMKNTIVLFLYRFPEKYKHRSSGLLNPFDLAENSQEVTG